MSLTGLTVLLVAIGVLVVATLVGLVLVFALDRDDEPPPLARKSPTAVQAVTGTPPAAARKKPAAIPAADKLSPSPTTSGGAKLLNAKVVKKSGTPGPSRKASPTETKTAGVPNKVVVAKTAVRPASMKATPIEPTPVAKPKSKLKQQVADPPRPVLTKTEGSGDVPSAPSRAGWYPDPGGDGQRYWNGEAWAYHRSATPAPPRRRWWHDRTKAVTAAVVATLAIAAATIGLVIYNSDESRFNRCVSSAMKQYPDAPLGVAYMYCDQFVPDRGNH